MEDVMKIAATICAVPPFVTVGNDFTAFLSGSVKGGGRFTVIFRIPTTH